MRKKNLPVSFRDLDRVCHENIKNLSDVKKCSCKKLAKARYEYFTYDKVFFIFIKIPSGNIIFICKFIVEKKEGGRQGHHGHGAVGNG